MSAFRSAAIVALIPAACFVEVPSSRPAGEGGAGGVDATGGEAGTGGGDGCPSDLGDCDGDGVCETDLSSDKDNCAACDRDCLGASCVDARCQPIQLRPGQTFPHYVAVDDTQVFWTTGGDGNGNGTVMKANKNGTGPRTLVDDGFKPRGITVDGGWVYWSDGGDGSLHRLPASADGTGQDEVLVAGVAQGDGEGFVRRIGDRLFWAYGPGGSVRSAALDGSDVVEHATGQPAPRQIAVLDDQIYFTVTDPELRRVPLGGGPVEVLVNPDASSLPNVQFGFGLLVVGESLVFRESDYGAGLNGRVTRFDPSTATFDVLTESPGARDLTADATHLFWTSDDEGSLSRSRHDGSEPTVIATGQDEPTGVAVDDEAVYWTNRALGTPGGGSIWKVAK